MARSLQSSNSFNPACAGSPFVTGFSSGEIRVGVGAALGVGAGAGVALRDGLGTDVSVGPETDLAVGAMRPVLRRTESGDADVRAGDADIRANVIARATTLPKLSAVGLRFGEITADGERCAGVRVCVARAAGA